MAYGGWARAIGPAFSSSEDQKALGAAAPGEGASSARASGALVSTSPNENANEAAASAACRIVMAPWSDYTTGDAPRSAVSTTTSAGRSSDRSADRPRA